MDGRVRGDRPGPPKLSAWWPSGIMGPHWLSGSGGRFYSVGFLHACCFKTLLSDQMAICYSEKNKLFSYFIQTIDGNN